MMSLNSKQFKPPGVSIYEPPRWYKYCKKCLYKVKFYEHYKNIEYCVSCEMLNFFYERDDFSDSEWNKISRKNKIKELLK